MKIHVDGKNKGHIMLYTLSTCGWCKKSKQLLKDLGTAYDFIDVDLLEGKEREKIEAEIKKWNSHISFPTIVINNDRCIIGFDEERIKWEIDK
jgi:glutaredoxin-like protein NrdH